MVDDINSVPPSSTRDREDVELDVEIAVVGGGPAGSIAASTLARAGVRVAIIDADDGSALRVGETVPPGFHAEIAGVVGLADALCELSMPAYGNRSVWGSDAALSFPFASDTGGGLHLDRARFDAFLLAQAVAAGAIPLTHTAIEDVVAQQDGGVALLANGTCVRASAVIDATGRGAMVARRLGAKRQLHDHMVAVLCRLGGRGAADEGFTQVEAVRDGWWYSAPLSTGGFVVAWMTDSDLLGPRGQLPELWQRRLDEAPHTRARIAGGTPVAEPEIRSAAIQRCRATRTAVRWIAVGDAALGVDPLSPCGIVRALRTGRTGALALLRALDGDRTAIDGYERGLDLELRAHLEQRAHYYAAEQRFAGAPFWHRRHPRVPATTSRPLAERNHG